MATENKVALEAYAHAQDIDMKLAISVLRSSADDPHAWDRLDFWLFVGCCCRLADSTTLLSQKDGVWSIVHIGIEVAKHCGELWVGCKLDNITDELRSSFEEPEDLQEVLDFHNAPDRAQYNNYKHLTGFHAPREEIDTPVYFRGLDGEAWKLKIAADWAVVTNRADISRPYADPAQYRQLLLVNLNRGLDATEVDMYVRNAIGIDITAVVNLSETWRYFMARRLKLMKSNGFCQRCNTDLRQCSDLLSHYMSCAGRCPGCQCVDHRVAQMAFCRCFHVERKAVVLFEDGFSVLEGRANSILLRQSAGVLMNGGVCTTCIVRRGLRPGQVASVQQRSFSSQISIMPASQEYELPDTGFMILVSGHVISFTTTDPRCDSCGAQGRLGTPLKMCAKCHAVRYCSVDCQRLSWNEHKLVCK